MHLAEAERRCKEGHINRIYTPPVRPGGFDDEGPNGWKQA